MTASPEIEIDFLYSPDCPAHERALALLEQVIRDEGVRARVHIHRIETNEEATAAHFPGSPTIRIDGVDIEEHPPETIALACRAYQQDDGTVSALPPRRAIAAALRGTE